MRKVAFLVANDECPEDIGIPELRFPRYDAKDLAELLADKEACGFEPKVYVNEPSHKVLEYLYEISCQLAADDILLFYYSGHGYRRGNELCLVSSNSKLSKLIPTSIKATEVLGYLRESSAKQRILVLDCCYSGVIGLQYKAGDTKSSLNALANDFGTCILTASTSIQLAEEREKDGHGLFTKALIDCLREPPKESINVDDWYHYAFDQLRIAGNQKPTKCGYVEGHPIEIGNFGQRFARLRQQELENLISIAPQKLRPYVELKVITKEQVESVVRLLERGEATLFPHDRAFRENVTRFLKGDTDDFLSVFGKEYGLAERRPKSPRDEVNPVVPQVYKDAVKRIGSQAKPPVVESIIMSQELAAPPTVDRRDPRYKDKKGISASASFVATIGFTCLPFFIYKISYDTTEPQPVLFSIFILSCFAATFYLILTIVKLIRIIIN